MPRLDEGRTGRFDSSSASSSVPSAPTHPWQLDDTLVQHRRAASISRSNRRGRAWLPMRSASAKPAVHHQQRPLTAAFEQRIGGNRGAHLHAVHELEAGRSLRRNPQHGLYPGNGGIPGIAPDCPTAACAWDSRPSGARAIMSVNVPPRSIQNCQPAMSASMGLAVGYVSPGLRAISIRWVWTRDALAACDQVPAGVLLR